jgi:hypothetical protein
VCLVGYIADIKRQEVNGWIIGRIYLCIISQAFTFWLFSTSKLQKKDSLILTLNIFKNFIHLTPKPNCNFCEMWWVFNILAGYVTTVL